MNSVRTDHRFKIQHVDKSSWTATAAANAAADHLHGHHELVRNFLSERPEAVLHELLTRLSQWTEPELIEYVEATRTKSLIFLVLMMTGKCNANCKICFTDRRKKAGETTPDERDALLREARDLGARYVYIPGEGEPTIDAGFWQLLETCREVGLEAIVFTNGIVFSDEISCNRYWGMGCASAARKMRQYPVSFYFKLWSMQESKAAELLSIPPRRSPYTNVDGSFVPAGLARLMDELPRERVGIEVVAERRNADEVIDEIVPFAEEHGLSRIVELIQHNGRVLDDMGYDPSPEQIRKVIPLLSQTSCAMAPCKAVVTSRGYLSPRIAVLEHQLPEPAAHIGSMDLFSLLHRTDYVVTRRYDINTCLCESLPRQLACNHRAAISLTTMNVRPSWLMTPASERGVAHD